MYIHDSNSIPEDKGEEIFHITGFTSGAILIGYDNDEISMADMIQVVHDATCEILRDLHERKQKAKEN